MSLTTRSYNGSNYEEMSDLLPHGLETSLSLPTNKKSQESCLNHVHVYHACTGH